MIRGDRWIHWWKYSSLLWFRCSSKRLKQSCDQPRLTEFSGTWISTELGCASSRRVFVIGPSSTQGLDVYLSIQSNFFMNLPSFIEYKQVVARIASERTEPYFSVVNTCRLLFLCNLRYTRPTCPRCWLFGWLEIVCLSSFLLTNHSSLWCTTESFQSVYIRPRWCM